MRSSFSDSILKALKNFRKPSESGSDTSSSPRSENSSDGSSMGGSSNFENNVRLAPVLRKGRILEEIRSEQSRYRHAPSSERVDILVSIARLKRELFNIMSSSETPGNMGANVNLFIQAIEAAKAVDEEGGDARPLADNLVKDIVAYINHTKHILGSRWEHNTWSQIAQVVASTCATQADLQLELGIRQYQYCIEICNRGDSEKILSTSTQNTFTLAKQSLSKGIASAKEISSGVRLQNKIAGAREAYDDLEKGAQMGMRTLRSIREAERYAFEKEYSIANTHIVLDKYREAKSSKEIFEDYVATGKSRFTGMYNKIDKLFSALYLEMQRLKKRAAEEEKANAERAEENQWRDEETQRKNQEEEDKQNKEIAKTIRDKSKNLTWQEFIRYLYRNHCPKNPINRKKLEQHILSDNAKEAFKIALRDYHPDRNAQGDKGWKSACLEAYKSLNMRKETI